MNQIYSFSHESPIEENPGFPTHSINTKRIAVSDNDGWPVIMREFANFLSGIYGYNITEKLLVEEWDGDHNRLSDYGV